MTEKLALVDDWVPASCTLPTVDQPLRRAEFDELFAEDVLSVRRLTPGAVRMELRPDPQVAARAAGLAAKETSCCSFFRFELTVTDGTVGLTVSTEATHEPVLAALAARAESRIGSSA